MKGRKRRNIVQISDWFEITNLNGMGQNTLLPELEKKVVQIIYQSPHFALKFIWKQITNVQMCKVFLTQSFFKLQTSDFTQKFI